MGSYFFTEKLFPVGTEVFYMSFDRFLLVIESRDLSQADKSTILSVFFPKLSDG